MPDFCGNNRRVASTLLLNKETLRPACRLSGNPTGFPFFQNGKTLCSAFSLKRKPSNGTHSSIKGKTTGSLFLANGKPLRPAFCLMEKLSDSILMDMKNIFALQEMGKEARDA